MADQVIEYGIEWTEPKDVAGSVTILGTGETNRYMALNYLRLCARLPGRMAGRVVERTITWSPWRGEQNG